MQLPDESILYQYPGLLVSPLEEWTPAAEFRAQHYLHPNELRDLMPRLLQVRSQVAAERELRQVPEEMQPLDSGFIDLPQKYLDQFRRQGDQSILGKVLQESTRLRDLADKVVILGIGGSYMGARALFEALRSKYHNELPAETRLNVPCIYFAGNNVDNDALQELLDMLQTTCVEPNTREERWGAIVISKSGGTLETATALRVIRKEMVDYYGPQSELVNSLLVPITGPSGKLRDLCRAEGYAEDNIFTIPDGVGGRFSVFTPVGLLPAAVMGLDVRALLLGAAAMTRRFLEEPFEQNPVLQYAAVNYLMLTEHNKPTRVLSIWSDKLEAIGLWYDQLLAESLGKHSQGPTPITTLQTRDLQSRGQQHQEGTRDKVINNLFVRTTKTPPIKIGMADNDSDTLNQFSRKTLPEIMDAAFRGTNIAYDDVARPTADLILPTLSEHTIGQLLQMFMLATVIEGRLLNINPYGQPGVEAYKRNMKALLSDGTPD
ncbi:MAG: glucose-6-phosphate isomerase [Gemmataceae bacterium]